MNPPQSASVVSTIMQRALACERLIRSIRDDLGGLAPPDALSDPQHRPAEGPTAPVYSGPATLPPRLHIISQRLTFGARTLDLSSSPSTLRIFTLFARSGNGTMSREELLAALYGKDRLRDASPRMRQSMHINAVKAVSRARVAAQTAFGRLGDADIQWFPYDSQQAVWRFWLAAAHEGPSAAATGPGEARDRLNRLSVLASRDQVCDS